MGEVDDAIRCYTRLVDEVERLRAAEHRPLRTVADVEAVCARHGLSLPVRDGLTAAWHLGNVHVQAVRPSSSSVDLYQVTVWAAPEGGAMPVDVLMSGPMLPVAVLDAAIVAALAAQEVAG